jgi:hypothetical protein
MRRLLLTGLLATVAAMLLVALAASIAHAIGVDFEVPEGGERIPLPGFAVVTGVFSLVGVAIAVSLRQWSRRPAERFLWTTVSLTALSLVPPLVSGTSAATTAALIGLHLVAASVMIPLLTCALRDYRAPVIASVVSPESRCAR